MGLAERGPAWCSPATAPRSHCSPSRISFLVLFSCYAGFFPSVLLPAECAGRDFPPGHLHLRIYIPKNQSPDGCGAVAGSGPFQVSYDLALFASAPGSEAPAGIKTKSLVCLPCSRGMGDSQRSLGQDVRREIFSRPCCKCAGELPRGEL